MMNVNVWNVSLFRRNKQLNGKCWTIHTFFPLCCNIVQHFRHTCLHSMMTRTMDTLQLLLIRKCVVQSHCKSTKWSIFHSLRPRPHNSDFCMPQQTSSSQPWEAKLSNVQDPMNAATYSITRSNISYSTHSSCCKVNKATSELLH